MFDDRLGSNKVEDDKNLQIELDPYDKGISDTDYDIDRIIYDLYLF